MVLSLATVAYAQPHHHHHHVTNNWLLPMIIGGVIGYELNRPQYVQPQPIVVYPVPTSNTQYCIHPLRPLIGHTLIVDPYYPGRYIQVEQFLGCTR